MMNSAQTVKSNIACCIVVVKSSILSTYRFPNIFRPIRGYSILRILVQIFPQVLQHRTESCSNLCERNIQKVFKEMTRNQPCQVYGFNILPCLTFFPVIMFIILTFSLPVRGLSALLLLFLLLRFTRS